MEIVKYKQDFKQAFIDLNLAWLNKYFRVEPQDTEMLNGVDDLIERGAAVYFAVEGNTAIATCMICPRNNNIWEICKLATDEKYQGERRGRRSIESVH